MKRFLAACGLALALGATGAGPASAAAPKPAGCPLGQWDGPSTTLEVAGQLKALYDGPQTVEEIAADLARADHDGDGLICLKINEEELLPDPAQVHRGDLVFVIDARSGARP